MYPINFTVTGKKICLSLHHNGANSYSFVNGTEIIKFKAKDSEIVATPLCLGNISKDWSVDNMKKTGFNGYVYDFSVDYDAIAVDDFLDIHNYLMKKMNQYNKMLGFIKRCFFTGLAFLSTLTSVNLLSAVPLICISMNNQKCKVRRQIVNVNDEGPVFFPFIIKTNKYSGSGINMNNPYAKLCVPDIVKNLNARAFNLILGTNETRHTEQHETCTGRCRLDASFCNNKQRWNDHKCRCECKERIDKGVCNKGSIWNPSNCECECDKSCDVGEYLDYENCKCRRKLVDKLVEECTKNIDEVKITRMALFEHGNECVCSYTI